MTSMKKQTKVSDSASEILITKKTMTNVLQKNPEVIVDEDPVIEERFQSLDKKQKQLRKAQKQKTIGERIRLHKTPLYKYKKVPHAFKHPATGEVIEETGKQTGTSIDV